jgi:hypothetical protein
MLDREKNKSKRYEYEFLKNGANFKTSYQTIHYYQKLLKKAFSEKANC